jgi:hypothetical protein
MEACINKQAKTYTELTKPVNDFTAVDICVQWHLAQDDTDDELYSEKYWSVSCLESLKYYTGLFNSL